MLLTDKNRLLFANKYVAKVMCFECEPLCSCQSVESSSAELHFGICHILAKLAQICWKHLDLHRPRFHRPWTGHASWAGGRTDGLMERIRG
jgi:hypothetical protein